MADAQVGGPRLWPGSRCTDGLSSGRYTDFYRRGVGQAVEEVVDDRRAGCGWRERLDGAAAGGSVGESTGRCAGGEGGEDQAVHGHDCDPGGDERLRGGQVVELVGDPWRASGLGE